MRNIKSREYITKLGFDQYPDLISAGKSHVTVYLESQLGKGSRQHLCSVGETSKIAVWDSTYNPKMQTDIIINLWPNRKPGFMLMLFALFCETWDGAKPGAWLASPPSGAQQSQDSSSMLSKVLQVLHSQQAVTHSHSQSGQCPSRLEARSETCSALSLKPKQEYFLKISLTVSFKT